MLFLAFILLFVQGSDGQEYLTKVLELAHLQAEATGHFRGPHLGGHGH